MEERGASEDEKLKIWCESNYKITSVLPIFICHPSAHATCQQTSTLGSHLNVVAKKLTRKLCLRLATSQKFEIKVNLPQTERHPHFFTGSLITFHSILWITARHFHLIPALIAEASTSGAVLLLIHVHANDNIKIICVSMVNWFIVNKWKFKDDVHGFYVIQNTGCGFWLKHEICIGCFNHVFLTRISLASSQKSNILICSISMSRPN